MFFGCSMLAGLLLGLRLCLNFKTFNITSFGLEHKSQYHKRYCTVPSSASCSLQGKGIKCLRIVELRFSPPCQTIFLSNDEIHPDLTKEEFEDLVCVCGKSALAASSNKDRPNSETWQLIYINSYGALDEVQSAVLSHLSGG